MPQRRCGSAKSRIKLPWKGGLPDLAGTLRCALPSRAREGTMDHDHGGNDQQPDEQPAHPLHPPSAPSRTPDHAGQMPAQATETAHAAVQQQQPAALEAAPGLAATPRAYGRAAALRRWRDTCWTTRAATRTTAAAAAPGATCCGTVVPSMHGMTEVVGRPEGSGIAGTA